MSATSLVSRESFLSFSATDASRPATQANSVPSFAVTVPHGSDSNSLFTGKQGAFLVLAAVVATKFPVGADDAMARDFGVIVSVQNGAHGSCRISIPCSSRYFPIGKRLSFRDFSDNGEHALAETIFSLLHGESRGAFSPPLRGRCRNHTGRRRRPYRSQGFRRVRAFLR